MRHFIIYQPAKSAMQSGKKNYQKWHLLPIDDLQHRYINPMLGWVSSNNSDSQLKFTFNSKEKAIDFAKKQGFDFVVMDHKQHIIKPKSYSDNFTK